MNEPDCVALAAQILTAYLSKNNVSPAEIPGLLRDVHSTLKTIAVNGHAVEEVAPAPAVPIKRSIAEDHVVCLVCGIELQSLKRHLGTKHELTPESYRMRFGLPREHPIVAPSYSRKRSSLAMKSGLGRKSSGRRSKR